MKSDNHLTVYFLIFIAGSIFSLVVTQIFFINPYIEQNTMVVKGLVEDIYEAEHHSFSSLTSNMHIASPRYRDAGSVVYCSSIAESTSLAINEPKQLIITAKTEK